RKVKLPVSYRIQETGSIGVFFMYQIRGSVHLVCGFNGGVFRLKTRVHYLEEIK
ncbi:hypothetical protein BA5240_5663, partial [Bacillus anthracis]